MRNRLIAILFVLSAAMMVSKATVATPAAQGTTIAGTAGLSGTVESTAPFKAAQVFLRNVDKRILYMVYTNAGQFRAVALFPGAYEVSSGTKGLESDVQKLVLKAGESPKLKLSLHAVNTGSARTIVNALETNTEANSTVSIEQSYDEIYPPGPGRDVAERTCIMLPSLITLPITFGSARSAVTQNLYVSTAAPAALGSSSRASSRRPSTGFRPITSK